MPHTFQTRVPSQISILFKIMVILKKVSQQQYTHAAIWVIIAMAKLGFGEKALELTKMINPINHSLNKESAKKYKVEPYVISADVYNAEGLKRNSVDGAGIPALVVGFMMR